MVETMWASKENVGSRDACKTRLVYSMAMEAAATWLDFASLCLRSA